MAGYLGASPVPQTIQKKQSFTATASQTTFTTTGYTDGQFINVYLNGVRLINGTDYTATNGSDIVLTTGASASDVLDFETFNEFTLVDQTLETPTFRTSATLKNDTEEDTDGGRESTLIFKGEQSGGEISTLAEIEASHDGTADDEKGDLIFRTNDGSDGSSPTEAARIDSGRNFLIGTTGVDPHNASSASDIGVAVRNDGRIHAGANGQNALAVNRLTSDGDIITLKKDGTTQGTIGAENGDLNIDGPSGHVGIRFQAASILPRYNGADANGNMDLGYDDGTDTHRWRNLYLSGGINFGLASGANVSSETLDDYEEGTWTPQCNTGTISSVSGNYTKIGRVVHITAVLDGFSNRTSGNGLVISNLPFAIGITNRTYPSGIFARDINQSPDAVYAAGSDSLTIYSAKATGAYEQVLHNDFNAATAAMYFSTTYYA